MTHGARIDSRARRAEVFGQAAHAGPFAANLSIDSLNTAQHLARPGSATQSRCRWMSQWLTRCTSCFVLLPPRAAPRRQFLALACGATDQSASSAKMGKNKRKSWCATSQGISIHCCMVSLVVYSEHPLHRLSTVADMQARLWVGHLTDSSAPSLGNTWSMPLNRPHLHRPHHMCA